MQKDKYEFVKMYEFDGTLNGVNLINERLYSEDKSGYKAALLYNGSTILRDGCILQKGDVYQVRMKEEFKAIG